MNAVELNVPGGPTAPAAQMGGATYDFTCAKKALDNVVPREEVKKVDVVRKRIGRSWDIQAML